MPDKPIYKFLQFIAFLVSQVEICTHLAKVEILKVLAYISTNKDGRAVILQNAIYRVILPLQNNEDE